MANTKTINHNDKNNEVSTADAPNYSARDVFLYYLCSECRASISEEPLKEADISRYLDKVEETTVNIVGHTDNTGVAASNMKLGLDRANFAKAYFIRNGIPYAKINTSSKGQTEPMESNAKEEGRTNKSRTIVTLN